MKKSLFLLGVAAAVFSGCSNQEVMDVAEYANQPIEFTTFVDKTTRSGDVTSQNFQKFWVFAQNKGTGDQNWADAFTNVQVSKAGDNEWLPINTYYWEKNKEFRFAGYANGESQLNKSIVSYDAGSQSGGSTSGLLTFTAYSTDGQNDLQLHMGRHSVGRSPESKHDVPAHAVQADLHVQDQDGQHLHRGCEQPTDRERNDQVHGNVPQGQRRHNHVEY